MISEDALCPWGPHQGEKLKDIPDEWWLWFLKQRYAKEWPLLYNYIEPRIDQLKETEPVEKRDPEAPMETYDDYMRHR